MAETLAGQAISIGQRSYAVFKVRPTCGGHANYHTGNFQKCTVLYIK